MQHTNLWLSTLLLLCIAAGGCVVEKRIYTTAERLSNSTELVSVGRIDADGTAIVDVSLDAHAHNPTEIVASQSSITDKHGNCYRLEVLWDDGTYVPLSGSKVFELWTPKPANGQAPRFITRFKVKAFGPSPNTTQHKLGSQPYKLVIAFRDNGHVQTCRCDFQQKTEATFWPVPMKIFD